MEQLKRSECAILPLVLKGKWYDMIASALSTRAAAAMWNRRAK